MSKKLTREEFESKARCVHGDKYNYDLVTYINNRTKVGIVCSEHGVFNIIPNSHLNGRGCKQCGIESRANKNRRTLPYFLKKCREVHGNRYDYSLLTEDNFKGIDSIVKIICERHGEFTQRAISHIKGHGCERCSYEERGSNSVIDPSIVLNRFRDLNGEEFEYDMTSYKDTVSKMRIRCKKHGWFLQSPSKHIGGRKCPSCKDSLLGDRSRSNKGEFIQKAREVHGDYYNYDKVVYRRNNIPVSIVCPVHGDFKQRTNNHLLGAGCPTCANISSMVKHGQNIPCKIYLLEFSGEEYFYKVGITRTIKKRLNTLRRETECKIKNICCIEAIAKDCVEVEQFIINKFRSYKYEPTVDFRGHTECFTKDLPIKEVKRYIEELKNIK